MKRAMSLLFFFGNCIASENKNGQEGSELLRQWRLFSLHLEPLQRAELDRYKEQFVPPCEKRRARGQKISKLSKEIDICHTEKQFALLCARVAKLQYQYRDYEHRKNFVVVEGNQQTSTQIINGMLVDGLRRIAEYKKWDDKLIPIQKEGAVGETDSLTPWSIVSNSAQEGEVEMRAGLLNEPFVDENIRAPMYPNSPVWPYVPRASVFSDSDSSLKTSIGETINDSSHHSTLRWAQVSSHNTSEQSV